MATELDTRQSENRLALPILGTNVNTQLNTILTNLNTELDVPLRLYATFPTPDANLHIRSSQISAADLAQKTSSPVANSVVNFVDSTINFQAGTTTGGTFLPNSGAGTITLPASTVGFYIRAGFSLLSDGTVQVLFSAQSATLIGLANAGTLFTSNGLAIGWIDLQATAATAYKTANSSTSIIENAPGGVPAIHRFGFGAGNSGTTSTSSLFDGDVTSVAYKANFNDKFLTSPVLTGPVNINAGFTDSSTYSVANQYYRLSYDASKTVTGTGTSMTISATPNFTVKVGDILRVGTEARRITVVTSQVLYTIESAFTTDPTAAACTISQVVYTVDLNGYAGDGVAASSLFSSNISSVLLMYEDTNTINDIIPDNGSAANIAATISTDGTSYSVVYTRPDAVTSQLQVLNTPISGTTLNIRFFSNKTAGSGAVNLLRYKAFFHRQDLGDNTGTSLNSAYCFTNGTGTEINCQPPTVVASKTRITLNFAYTTGIQAGTTNGQLDVYINGQKIPRFVDGTLTPDASYTEVSNNIIDLDSDYSGYSFPIEINKPVAFIDYSETNSTTLQTIDAPYDVQNYSVVTSEAANALTISLKNPAGDDPTTLNPVRASFIDAVGGFDKVTITSAVSLTISSGSTLGHVSGVNEYIYVYLVNNAGTISMAAITSENLIDEGSLQTVVAEGGAGAADSRITLYGPAGLASKPVRLIARLKSNQAAAGTWITPISETSLTPFKKLSVGHQVSASSNNFSTVSTSYVDVTNLTVTITTTGKPVMLMIVPDGGSSEHSLNVFNNDGLGHVYNVAWYKWVRNGSDITYDNAFGARFSVSTQPTATYINYPQFFDAPAAGTYTYKIQTKRAADPNASGVEWNYLKLIAYEL